MQAATSNTMNVRHPAHSAHSNLHLVQPSFRLLHHLVDLCCHRNASLLQVRLVHPAQAPMCSSHQWHPLWLTRYLATASRSSSQQLPIHTCFVQPLVCAAVTAAAPQSQTAAEGLPGMTLCHTSCWHQALQQQAGRSVLLMTHCSGGTRSDRTTRCHWQFLATVAFQPHPCSAMLAPTAARTAACSPLNSLLTVLTANNALYCKKHVTGMKCCICPAACFAACAGFGGCAQQR